jgi:hypothetical protein
MAKRKLKHELLAAATCLSLFFTSEVQGEDLRGLPARDPAPLEKWLALDDARFNALINANWNSVVAVLQDYNPPGTLAFPPLSFAGPQRSCLEDQVPAACRVYIADLVRINRGRSGTAAASNPFGR